MQGMSKQILWSVPYVILGGLIFILGLNIFEINSREISRYL